MQMKKLIINGQTFIIVDAEAMKKLADSDLNMQGKTIYGAHVLAQQLSFAGQDQGDLVDVVSGSVAQGVPLLLFTGYDEGSMPVLRNIHDGIEDNDAATVGQIKGVEETAIKKNTNASVSSVKILHSPETMDAIDMVGSLVHDASKLVVNVLTISGDAEGEQTDTNTTILRGIHKGEEPFDAVNKAQLDEAIADAIANLPVYNGEVEEV